MVQKLEVSFSMYGMDQGVSHAWQVAIQQIQGSQQTLRDLDSFEPRITLR